MFENLIKIMQVVYRLNEELIISLITENIHQILFYQLFQLKIEINPYQVMQNILI